MLHASLDIPRNRNVKFFPSSKSKHLFISLCSSLRFRVMCEHLKRNSLSLWLGYKRCISWPGTRLPERRGNPLVHDLLDRLGLLEPGTKEQIMMDMDENEDASDTSQDVTSLASTMRSPERLQNVIHNGTEPRSEDFSTLSPCSTLQQQLCSDGSANRLTAQPWQYQPRPLLSLPPPI